MEKEVDGQSPTQEELVMRAKQRLRHQTNPAELMQGRKRSARVHFYMRHEVEFQKCIPELAQEEQEASAQRRRGQDASSSKSKLSNSNIQQEASLPIKLSDLKIYKLPDQQGLERSMRRIQSVKRTPYSVSDLLFLQGYKDVNPYLETLKKIQSIGSEEWQDRSRIEELCYMGIGRSVVEVKKRSKPPYSRVNLLIREFMMESMVEEVEKRREVYPSTCYVMCCKHSLGFKPTIEGNDELRKLVEEDDYQRIILTINEIIERNFLKFKRKKPQEVSSYNHYSMGLSGVGLLLLLLALFCVDHAALMIAAWSLLGLALLINLIGVFRSSSILRNNDSIITTIQREIEQELAVVNNRQPKVEWRCGTDFYWLEVKANEPSESGASEIVPTQQQLL